MKTSDIEEFSKNINGKIIFDYNVKRLNWFNIGGKTKIYFSPENLSELIDFLKLYNNRGKIFILGAGSNVLFSDKIFEGVIIKLGKKFSNISKLDENKIVAGSLTTDKKLSEFAKENGIGGFEFLSGIPGTIGGGIKMNSGCFNNEFKDILISIQALDYSGKVHYIPAKNIKFSYRTNNLSENIIYLSGTFEGEKKSKKSIEYEINKIKHQKELSQPSRIKTCGSTFKNPLDQSNKKVWQLIKESVPLNLKFGDAVISKKHCNFFINQKNASFQDMKKLINFVQKKVKQKTGINLHLELVLVE
tara:strand:+ start:519 stop:1427 length:909 start_codon:yes stop_codon:yes gene_type:complete